MAPSSGHILVPKVINAFKYAVSRTAQAIRARLAQGGSAQPVAIPVRAARQPIHPLAALRQARGQSRSFSTSIRKAIVETYPSLRSATVPRASFPVSRTSTLLARTPGASTFASTLRPNLTGGALPRTAGGYGNIGGKRMFSSIPGSQAQVISNVSAGVRAFWLGGQRAQFDGMDSLTGEKRFVTVGTKQEDATRKIMAATISKDSRGTSLEFCVAPSLTSFGKSKESIIGSGLDDAVAPLATDFARSLGALAAVHRDLKALSSLGNLTITEPRPGWLSVRFPGCDARTVESLCDELGIFRGIVREDAAWQEEQSQDVKMALLFPTAPSDSNEADEAFFYPVQTPPQMRKLSLEHTSYTADETLSALESLHSFAGLPHSFEHISAPRSTGSWQPNPWHDASKSDSDHDEVVHDSGGSPKLQTKLQDVHDMDNIYKFLAECDGRLG